MGGQAIALHLEEQLGAGADDLEGRDFAQVGEKLSLSDNAARMRVDRALDKLRGLLARRGIQMVRVPRADVAMTYFGMENPVVGGYTPQKVALRRAIALAVDVEREIRLVRRGQAIPAQSIVGPLTDGFDPAFKSEMSEFSIARAKALLEMGAEYVLITGTHEATTQVINTLYGKGGLVRAGAGRRKGRGPTGPQNLDVIFIGQ